MPKKLEIIDGETWTLEDSKEYNALQRKLYRTRTEYREKRKKASRIRNKIEREKKLQNITQ